MTFIITFLYSLKISKLDRCNRNGFRLNKIWKKEMKVIKKYDYKSYDNFADNPTIVRTTIALKLCSTWLSVRAFKGYLTVRAANVCPVNISQRKFLTFPFCVLYVTDMTARNKSVRFYSNTVSDILSSRHIYPIKII